MSYIPLTDWIVRWCSASDRNWWGVGARILVDSSTVTGPYYNIYVEYSAFARNRSSNYEYNVMWYYEDLSNYIKRQNYYSDWPTWFTTGASHPVGSRDGSWENYKISRGSLTAGTVVKTGQAKQRTTINSITREAYLTSSDILSHTIETVSISYNPNGGSGTVATQSVIKTLAGYEIPMTIASGSGLSRTNFRFLGWSTNSAATVPDSTYDPGQTYAGSNNLVLYAVWERIQNVIHFEANIPAGASGNITVPDDVLKDPGATYTFDSSPTGSLVPPYDFVSWNTSSTGTGTTFAIGSTYSNDTDLTVYAQWYTDYRSPDHFLTANIGRVDEHGNPDKTGEFLNGVGSVRVYATGGSFQDVTDPTYPAEVSISWTNTINGTQTTVSSDITSSLTSLGQHYKEDGITPDYEDWSFQYDTRDPLHPQLVASSAYTAQISWRDPYMNRYNIAALTQTFTISVAFVTFSTGGKGKTAAFGKAAAASTASANGYLDLWMDTEFHGDVFGLPVDGTTIAYNGNDELSYIGQTEPYEETTGGNSLDSFTNSTWSSWPTTPDYAYPPKRDCWFSEPLR